MKEIIKIVKYTKISYTKKQSWCMVWVLLNTLLTLGYPGCISFVIDQGIAKGDLPTVIRGVSAILLFGVLIILTNYLYQIKSTKLGREICETIKNNIFRKLCNTTYRFWSENRKGDVFTTINTDVASIEKIFTTIVNNGILNGLHFMGIIIILFLFNYIIGFLITILLLVFIILQKRNGEKVKIGMDTLRNSMGEFNSITQEMINYMPDIQLVYPKQRLESKYIQKNRITNILYVQQMKNILSAKNIGMGFNTISIFIVLFIGALGVIEKNMSVGTLFSIVIYVQQLYSPAIALGDIYNTIKNAQPSVKRIIDLLENKNMIKHGTLIPDKKLIGKIVFEHVNFSYGENKRSVFQDINLKLKPGKIYGIVGDNGKGKSTFIRLIAGLCSPDSGHIYIDDIDIETYDVEYLRKHIGYLPQKPIILSGEEVVKDGQRKEILKKISLEHIESVGDNGLGVSGGENQKLALVHLLGENEKDIFILDEPTAALDLKSEEILAEQIKSVLKGKTVLLITHRINILKICNEIIDFNKIASYKNVRTL